MLEALSRAGLRLSQSRNGLVDPVRQPRNGLVGAGLRISQSRNGLIGPVLRFGELSDRKAQLDDAVADFVKSFAEFVNVQRQPQEVVAENATA